MLSASSLFIIIEGILYEMFEIFADGVIIESSKL
jgi:hypothetical protein